MDKNYGNELKHFTQCVVINNLTYDYKSSRINLRYACQILF